MFVILKWKEFIISLLNKKLLNQQQKSFYNFYLLHIKSLNVIYKKRRNKKSHTIRAIILFSLSRLINIDFVIMFIETIKFRLEKLMYVRKKDAVEVSIDWSLHQYKHKPEISKLVLLL